MSAAAAVAILERKSGDITAAELLPVLEQLVETHDALQSKLEEIHADMKDRFESMQSELEAKLDNLDLSVTNQYE